MKVYEIGTGYTPIPATMGAATEIVVEELTKAFMKMDVPVEIIDIKAKERQENSLPISEVWVPGCFTGTDVKLGIMHKLKRVMYSVCLAQKLKKILKSCDEKVVFHFHNQYNMFFFLKLTPQKLREKAMLAYTVHSHVWHGDWSEIEKTVKERYFQEVSCLQQADIVYVLNKKALTNIIQNIAVDEAKVRLIDNGVNTQIYQNMSADEKAEEKKKKGLQDKKVFVQVGSVCHRKNQLEALELLVPHMKKDKNIMFMYAGGIIEPEYNEKINDMAQRCGVAEQVRYCGELKPGAELNKFYNLSEAMVFPSKAEGFSLVIMEAMAAGVPVIVSKDLEFLLSDACIQYANAQEFNEKIEGLILNADQRNAISTSVRATVEAQYSWHKVAKDYFESWKHA